jgi:hypothetical protein
MMQPSLLALLATLAACGGGRTLDRREPPAQPQPTAIASCCDPGFADFQVTSKVPVAAVVCRGVEAVWTGTVRPDQPLEVPVAKVAGGKPVDVQFSVGAERPRCLDRATLAKVPVAREQVDLGFVREGKSCPIVPCRREEGCSCPVCPEPKSGC